MSGRLKPALLFSIFVLFFASSLAQGEPAFRGRVNADGINVRTDSTVNAEIICQVNNGDEVEVVSESYGWYKIQLPKNAAVFIKKEFVFLSDNKSATVLTNNVNIRLKPDVNSAVIGKVDNDNSVLVLEDEGGWYKIEPPKNAFGWINTRFVDRVKEISEEERMAIINKIIAEIKEEIKKEKAKM